MASLEYNLESLLLTILGASADLLNFQLVHKDDDDDAGNNRIVVSSQPRTVEIPGLNAGQARVWRVPVEVSVYFVIGTAVQVMDGVVLAIEAAVNASQPPAAALADWQTLQTITLENDSAGSTDADSNTRTRARAFYFLVAA